MMKTKGQLWSGYATLITGDEEKTTFSDLVHALGVIFNLCSH
jgi:hypothetical protein